MFRRAAARTGGAIRQRAVALWLGLADAFDDIFLFPSSQDRKNEIICAAINARRPLTFTYRGGSRTVEPFCLGRVHRGPRRNESLLCYQTGGYAELVEMKGWKLYRAREIEDPSVGEGTFAGDRPGYDPDELPMYRVYCRVVPERKWTGPAPRSIEDLLKQAGEKAREKPPLSHEELMHRFRTRHPEAVPDLDDVGEITPPGNAGPASGPPAPGDHDNK